MNPTREPPPVEPVNDNLALCECYDLLLDVIDFNRPMPGGFAKRARKLLERHGVIEVNEEPKET